MDLIKLRDEFLLSVAQHPLHDWPGPPKGKEHLPSCSYIGPEACRRKAYYRILRSMGVLDYEPEPTTPEKAGNDLAPQRGWILEDATRHWLEQNGVEDVRTPVDAFTGNFYYGHVDGICTIDEVSAVLEIKHQGAMAYMRILREGIIGGAPLYYAQVQGYLALTGLNVALVVVLPFDPSSAKGDITMGKRRKDYAGDLEPNFRQVVDSSGVNPFAYFEIIQANIPFQKGLDAWAKKLVSQVESKEVPDRSNDVDKDWQCRAEWCEYRALCLADGACKGDCAHKACFPQGSEPEPTRGMSR